MKTWLGGMIMSAFLSCGGFLSTANGQLVWEKTQVALDAERTVPFVDAVFTCTNQGSAAVTLRSVVSSCGCTVAKAAQDVIGPGERGVINARFTVGQREGRQEKTILVTTDDAQSPATLHLIVNLPHILRLQPTSLSWILGETPAAKTLVVEVAPDAPLKSLTAIPPAGSAFRQEVRTIVEGRKYEVVLTPQTTGQVSMNNFRLLCGYSDGRQRTLWTYARVVPASPSPMHNP